jgi:hypothetical protein
MKLTRISTTIGAVVLGAGLVATTYGAQAADTAPNHRAHPAVHQRFEPPVVHKYLPNGMRMGLHCDSDSPTAGM